MSVSNKGNDWKLFAQRVHIEIVPSLCYLYAVFQHIENYAVPQYGDTGVDQVTDYTAEDCIKAMRKYQVRRGRNARPGQEVLDELKIGHYIQMAVSKGAKLEDLSQDLFEASANWAELTEDLPCLDQYEEALAWLQ